MTMTIPFSERLSEQWLIERTYHAHLRDGRELPVFALTEAMKQLIDFSLPLSLQSWKSKLAQNMPLKMNTNFSVPLSTWGEISQEEAHAFYRQGIPILLYGEHVWTHSRGASGAWKPSRNMRVIISGNDQEQPEADSGTEYAVCYMDLKRGTFSNDSWKSRFSSEITTLLESSAGSAITFFSPSVQFPYSTHYTVIAADGQVHEYADRDGAIQGFQELPTQEVGQGSAMSSVFPQFCYYHDVTCPGGVYRLEFFGPHMDEQGYPINSRMESSKGAARKSHI
jgi:hypothetical protein